MIKDEETVNKLIQRYLLSGAIVCGKTSVMHHIKPFSASCYKIKTCREIVFEFAKNGYEAIYNYTQ